MSAHAASDQKSPSLHSASTQDGEGANLGTPLAAPNAEPPESAILTGPQLALVFAAMMLALLLIALDGTILATALPRIASDFHSFSLQGWVSSSFILAQTVFLLFYGQLLRTFPAKWILISAITIFELGSLVCGVSQSVGQLIAGRAVTGVGGAGIFLAIMQVISQITHLEDRAKFLGLFGSVFALSSVIGPLIGGALTDNVTWRWVFFINFPIGGVSVVAVLFLLKASAPLGSDPTKRSQKDIFQQFLRLDFIGATLVAGAVTCLVLALQWGGNIKPWGDKAVIICFVFSALLAVICIFWEVHIGDRAMVPKVIFKSRSIYGIIMYCLLTRFSLLLFSYYIPIFYQAVKHHSATKSGIDIFPFVLGVIITLIASGQIVAKTGYYWPFLAVAPVFLAVGSGLLYTLNASTSSAKLVGFQILAGIGTGMGMQNSLLAIQAEFQDSPALLAQALAMASFAQFLGGTLGLGVAEPVFSTELTRFLLRYAPDAPAIIVKEAPTAIYTLPPDMIAGVVRAYAEALRVVFVVGGVPVAGFALVSVVFIKNIRIAWTTDPAAAAKDPAPTDAEKGEKT
ncbi:putative transporter [Mycena rebaudengoi]|nr:putative transporter [Mycena rebaudengoi]